MALALRYAARSDVGLVRQNNQDSGYAGPHLLVVADGMGGHAGGDVASSLAIGELAPLDDESHGSDALEHLSKAVLAAHRELLGRVGEEPQLAGMGTTITALLRTGNKLAMAHIGDSRAYLLRDGSLVQITKDHTFVQTLVDEGRLTLEEAEAHPQRSVLMKVLSDVVDDVEPDFSMREARVGDRYLLCSDGLSGVVSFDTLRDTMAAADDPATTCESLVQLALRGGAPDNVTCIVADVIESTDLGDHAPFVVGAASARQTVRSARLNGSAAERAAALTAPPSTGVPEPSVAAPRRSRGRVVRRLVGVITVLAVLVAGSLAAWEWVQHQYFVGARDGSVTIFRGLPESLGPIELRWVDTVAPDVPVNDLPGSIQDNVTSGMPATSREDAQKIVANLRQQTEACRAVVGPSPSPSPGSPSPRSPSPSATPSRSPVPSPGATAPAAPTPTVAGKPSPTVASTVGSPVVAVNPQATGLVSPTVTPTPVPRSDCGRRNP